jgi:hypothetical protein
MKRILKALRCAIFHVDAPIVIEAPPDTHSPFVAIFLGRCYCAKCGWDLTP